MRFVLMRVKAIASRQAIAAALPARILMKAILVSTKAIVPGPRARLEFKYVTVVGASGLVPYIRDRSDKLTRDEIGRAVAALRAI